MQLDKRDQTMKLSHLTFAATTAVLSFALVGPGSADAQPRSKRAAPAAPPALDLSTPEGALAANRKIQCSTKDGEAVTYYWAGDAFSRREGEADKLLFRAEGMNIRHCVTVNDPVRGLGYRLISKELLIYRDARTGEVLKTWANPWTGETVDVLHVANDPVNSASYVKGRDGSPLKWTNTMLGDMWFGSFTVPLFYRNPLAGDYQAEVGGTYHATEMFNFSGSTASLIDGSTNTAPAAIAWSRMSDWLPWMKMGGRDGLIYFNTIGRKLGSFDELPAWFKAEIAQNYPDYTAPPPLDDTRPNETSWTYFKAVREGKKAAPKRN
jgi:Protein of unknown function (DUF1838)